MMDLGRCLAAVGFRRLSLAVSQVPLLIGLAGFVMLVEELRSIPVHLGSLVMNGRCMLICPGKLALMRIVQALPVGFAHHPSLLRENAGHKTCQRPVSKIMWVSGPMTLRNACPVIVPGRCRSGAVWRCHLAGFGRRGGVSTDAG